MNISDIKISKRRLHFQRLAEFFVTMLLFVASALWLWLKIPQYLLYQEQYQLFLFTGDYFSFRFAMPGGLADYIAEFIVQFYYVPLYGAILTAFVIAISQLCLGLACRRCYLALSCYVFASVPSIIFLGAMSDENILLSFASGMLLTSLFVYLDTLRRPTSSLIDVLISMAGFVMLYWMAGPLAFAYLVAIGILRRHPLAASVAFIAGIVIVLGIRNLWFEQFPIARLLLGINYYRVPEVYPAILFVIAALIALIPLMTLIKLKSKSEGVLMVGVVAAIVAVFGIIYVPKCFNTDKSRVFSYDALVRQGRWGDIIDRAKDERPSDNFSLQAVNLALAMTGQLTESMFHFNQKGLESLIGKSRLDNTSQLVTSEILYRLGLTNIAFSTTFDLQEAIMNDRKSGRFMKRMAECMIVKGEYKVAEKYIYLLTHSLFYSDWARKAKKLLRNDAAVESHPVYGHLRKNAFSKVAFYDHAQTDKIFAMLADDSDGANRLAWQYFAAAAMLNGDIPLLIGIYNSMSPKFEGSSIPRHLQEAMAMYWTLSHNSFEGIPFPISGEVQHQTADLARTVMQNQNNPSAWQSVAPDSFSLYFLKLQRNGRQTPSEDPEFHHG